MKLKEVLSASERSISFEVFPPKTEKGMENLRHSAAEFAKWTPSFISVTYGAGGSNKDNAIETVVSLEKEVPAEILAHLTAIGATRSEIEGIMEIYRENDIANILALRGDPPKDSPGDFPAGDFPHASDLVSFIRKNSDFSVGVAVYPEGHFESESIEKDMEYTKAKIDAGADFAITQMFFENSHFYSFIERCEKYGIDVPIIAGIMPVLNFDRIVEFADFCKTEIPGKMVRLMEPLKGKPGDMKKAGVDYALEQCLDLKKHGFERFHFFTLNKYASVVEILKKLSDEI